MSYDMNDTIQHILGMLKESKDRDAVLLADPVDIRLLQKLGVSNLDDGQWIVKREERIDLATVAVSHGVDMERVVKVMSWKDFEGFVGRVLDENGYKYTESFRKRGTGETEGMEIDVVGVKGKRILSLDAKMWGDRSGKTSALVAAAEKQATRTSRLGNELERLQKKIGVLRPGEYNLLPAIVTWLVEDIQFHEGVPIVPIFKLNAFLLELDNFAHSMISYKIKVGS